MAQLDKLKERIRTAPKDFSWREMKSLLTGLGYQEYQGDGSRVKFRHPDTRHKILLHKPHPGNIVCVGAVKDVIETLEEQGLL